MKLSEFKNKYGLSGLYSKQLDYGLGYEDKTEEVINDFRQLLIYILLSLPKGHELCQQECFDNTDREYFKQGYNKCLKEVRDIITNLFE